MRSLRDIISESDTGADGLSEDHTLLIGLGSAATAAAGVHFMHKLPDLKAALRARKFNSMLRNTMIHDAPVVHESGKEGRVVGKPNSHTGKYTIEWGDGSDSNHHAGNQEFPKEGSLVMPRSYYEEGNAPFPEKVSKKEAQPFPKAKIVEPVSEPEPPAQHPEYESALEGLKSLGIKEKEAHRALGLVDVPHDQPASELIKAALKATAKV